MYKKTNRTFTGSERNFYRLKKNLYSIGKKTTCTDGITQHITGQDSRRNPGTRGRAQT